MAGAGTGRHVKGTSLIELVKALRVHQRRKPLTGLSAAARSLLDEKILPSQWYAYEPFIQLLELTYRDLLGRSEANALQMGVAGARVILQGPHKGFLTAGDPVASVMSMRHAWRSYYDFGQLDAELDGESAVLSTVTGYADVPCVHGMMIAGWHVATAQLTGAPHATCDVIERPWEGASRMRLRIRLR